MNDLRDFPGAPEGAFISDEGWLVLGQEAWTVEEWRATPEQRPRTARSNVRHASEEERRAAVRASKRRWEDRKRLDPAYRAHERALRRARKAAAA